MSDKEVPAWITAIISDRFDVQPMHESETLDFHLGWELCARSIMAAIREQTDMAKDLADYLLDHYGTCTREDVCICRKIDRQFGRDCPFWRSAGRRTWAELHEWQERARTKTGADRERKESISGPKSGPKGGQKGAK